MRLMSDMRSEDSVFQWWPLAPNPPPPISPNAPLAPPPPPPLLLAPRRPPAPAAVCARGVGRGGEGRGWLQVQALVVWLWLVLEQ